MIIVILSCVLIFVLLVVGYNQIINHTIATDSGWDSSYDSGGGDGGGDISFLIYMALEHPLLTLIVLVCFFTWKKFDNDKKRKADGSNVDYIVNSRQDEATKKILLQAYQIFYDTQMAWMNFDYNKLKLLVTDELYNNYYNQLETLRLKNQRNIMRDFKVLDACVLVNKEEDGVSTIVVSLKVSFYDYVINCANNKVVRGKDTSKITMYYHITYVSSLNSQEQDKCPNCGAPLETPNYCDYCKSHIQGLNSGMRMAKKEVIRQVAEKR